MAFRLFVLCRAFDFVGGGSTSYSGSYSLSGNKITFDVSATNNEIDKIKMIGMINMILDINTCSNPGLGFILRIFKLFFTVIETDCSLWYL